MYKEMYANIELFYISGEDTRISRRFVTPMLPYFPFYQSFLVIPSNKKVFSHILFELKLHFTYRMYSFLLLMHSKRIKKI